MAVDTKDSDSVCSYINKNYQHIVSLYNKGEYEAVIAESDEFENDYKLQEILFPILVKCRNIADKCMSPKAKVHFRNERILRYFGWVDNIKYLTGAASLVFWYLLANNSKKDMSFFAAFLAPHGYLVWMIVFASMIFLIHKFMGKFTISEGLIRCKYCGRYTYIKPDKSTSEFFIKANICRKCKRRSPVPNFYWDGWVGLVYMKDKTSLQEDFFRELKEKYSGKYATWNEMRASALLVSGEFLGTTLALNNRWDQFSEEEKELLLNDNSTLPQELQEKVNDLLDGLENKR